MFLITFMIFLVVSFYPSTSVQKNNFWTLFNSLAKRKYLKCWYIPNTWFTLLNNFNKETQKNFGKSDEGMLHVCRWTAFINCAPTWKKHPDVMEGMSWRPGGFISFDQPLPEASNTEVLKSREFFKTKFCKWESCKLPCITFSYIGPFDHFWQQLWHVIK